MTPGPSGLGDRRTQVHADNIRPVPGKEVEVRVPRQVVRRELHALQIFTVTAEGISRNSVFQDSEVFASFGLAAGLDAHTG